MTPSENAYKLIKESEGLELEAYPDPGTGGDPWTIGYGHTGPEVKKGFKIDLRRAEAYLVKDVQWAADLINEVVTVGLTQNQFDALVSFVYNIGPRNFQNSTLLRNLNFGRYEDAADQFKVWNKGGGNVLPGLVTRRKNEADLFRRV